MRRWVFRTCAPLSLVALLLTGCGFDASRAIQSSATLSTIRGNVHGGQQPVAGAHVYVMATGITAYAGPGIAASVTNASTSLLTAAVLTNNAGFSGVDALGFYVRTRADGSFTVSGDYTCVANTGVYLYVTGGNPGAGANAAAGFLAPLGMCPATGGNLASITPTVWVNEISTIATAYALAGFASDATHISTSGSTLAATGLGNAFGRTATLYNIANGTAYSSNNSAVIPQSTIDTLADILASCVNSSGSSSAACDTLFADTGVSTSLDTASVAISIAHAPGNNVSGLYGLQTAAGAPFQPSLNAAPLDFAIGIRHTVGVINNFTLPQSIAEDNSGNIFSIASYASGSIAALDHVTGAFTSYNSVTAGVSSPGAIGVDNAGTLWVAGGGLGAINAATGAAISGSSGYTGGGLSSVQGLAIDGSGKVWTTSMGNTLNAFDPSTTSFASSSGFTGGGLAQPMGVAVDAGGSVWVANPFDNVNPSSVSKFTNAGVAVSGALGYGSGVSSMDGARDVAVDAAGNIWVISSKSNAITKLDSLGNVLSGDAGYTGGGLYAPRAIAIDGAGNVWAPDYQVGGVSEFSNAGVPVTSFIGYGAVYMNEPYAVAIDLSGNVWAPNGNNLTELVGAATPVVTPQYGVAHNAIASRP